MSLYNVSPPLPRVRYATLGRENATLQGPYKTTSRLKVLAPVS